MRSNKFKDKKIPIENFFLLNLIFFNNIPIPNKIEIISITNKTINPMPIAASVLLKVGCA